MGARDLDPSFFIKGFVTQTQKRYPKIDSKYLKFQSPKLTCLYWIKLRISKYTRHMSII